jgi:hypothetical protein
MPRTARHDLSSMDAFGGPNRRPAFLGCTCRLIRSAMPVRRSGQVFLERTTGFEPATPTLARWCSTN